uniref:Uncharacterized protein n=1 Tax=Avena sativa TaxID=4498 RepID=A0ACD5XXK4_AVESA
MCDRQRPFGHPHCSPIDSRACSRTIQAAMASSGTAASWSPDGLLDEPTHVEAPRTSTDGGDGEAKRVTSRSRLRSRETLRSICKKYSIPDGFAPILAGDLSACSLPPPGSVCVHFDALDAGMRLPLHPFYGAVLSHFGIAPGQLAPNSWRALAGFVVLSHFAGEAPSLAVFRHFFRLSTLGQKAQNKQYSFHSRDAAGLLFGRLNGYTKGWQEEFFFLSSSAPWPCPVEWGVPSRSATFGPTLTGQEKAVADKLLLVRGSCPIDLSRYLHERNMAAAKIIRPAPSPSPTPKGMEAPVNVNMEDVRAGKAAAATAWPSAGKVTVKSEPKLEECSVPPCTPSLGKKRRVAEDREKREISASDVSCPPGFSTPLMPPASSKDCGEQPREPRQHRGGETGDWQAARQLLQGIAAPSQERELAASKPANVVASSYVSLLQTVNEVALSLEYALDLEDKLRASKREADVLRARERDAAEEADALRAELAETKAAAAAARGFSGTSREQARALADRERVTNAAWTT